MKKRNCKMKKKRMNDLFDQKMQEIQTKIKNKNF